MTNLEILNSTKTSVEEKLAASKLMAAEAALEYLNGERKFTPDQKIEYDEILTGYKSLQLYTQ